jgi:UDP-3-O-[3-hydroxymyristoyl] glucosamine N-acyltransferase
VIEIAPTSLGELVDRHGGALDKGIDPKRIIRTIGPSDREGADLAPVLRGSHIAATGILLVDKSVQNSVPHGNRWIHASAEIVLLQLLGEEEPVTQASPIIYPNVRLGRRVRIGPGSVIGAPGFRFVGDKRMAHRAGVVIEDDVEIGANCTVDAGILSPTTIKRGTKIDSQVHVGHGVVIGENCRIAAQVGLAGSVVIADDVWIGGQVGIADHCRIGKGARIGAKAGVIGDIAAGAVVAGYPAVPRTRWLRGLARLYRRQ